MSSLVPLAALLGLLSAAGGRSQIQGNNEDLCHTFRGKVVQLTETTFTIKPEGFVKTVEYRQVGGVEVTRTYIQDNTKLPRTFAFRVDLLHCSGLTPGGEGGPPLYFDHLVTDLKVGDEVYINFSPFQGKECCHEIKIESRPDGKVPPTVWQKQEVERKEKERKQKEKR